MNDLDFSVERELVIRAPRATVFSFFTDSERWARWWGEGSTIEGHVGGKLRIVYPGGATASGEVLALEPDERIAFSFGYDAGEPIAAGASRVTITLADDPDGTRLELRHEVAEESVREAHVQGWRYQLAVFANAVANLAHADAESTVARWFAAWSAETDAIAPAFDGLVTDDVVFQDGFSCVAGAADLAAHVAACRVHMPGVTMVASGAPRQCQGTVVADWTATTADGKPAGSGTNVFELAPDGRVRRAVGFWSLGG